MKIGIGCLTYNRPEHFNLWYEETLGTSDPHVYDTTLVIAKDTDEDRRGIAFRSNEILRKFKEDGVDFGFIFNDDCFALKDGWVRWFINAHEATGQHHFNYMLPSPTHKIIGQEKGIEIFNEVSGTFMFLTKECIEKVGAFDERFGRRGFEHANFTIRVHMAWLTPMGKYLSVRGANNYLYSLDLQNDREYNKLVRHAPSMKPLDAIECEKKAREHFEKPIEEIYIPL